MTKNKKKSKNTEKELHLEKKIIWISILGIFLLLLLLLLIFIFHPTEEGYPVVNISNHSEELAKEHCLGDICIRDMRIDYYKDSISSISGIMINKSGMVKDACLKIKFSVMGKEDTYDFDTCYYDMKPGDETEIETYFHEDKEDLIRTIDYTLAELREEELKVLYQSRDEELKNIFE